MMRPIVWAFSIYAALAAPEDCHGPGDKCDGVSQEIEKASVMLARRQVLSRSIQAEEVTTITKAVTVELFKDAACTKQGAGHGNVTKTIFRKVPGSKCFTTEYFKLDEPGSGLKGYRLDGQGNVETWIAKDCAGTPNGTFPEKYLGLERLRCPPNGCVPNHGLFSKWSGTGFDPDSDKSPTCTLAPTPQPAPQPTPVCPPMEQDTDFNGNDVALPVTKPTAATCQLYCSTTFPNAQFFSFNAIHIHKPCHCKTSDSGRRVLQGIVSGKVCSTALTPQPTPQPTPVGWADYVYSGCYVNHGAARQEGHEQNKLGHSFGACAKKALVAGAVAFGLEDPKHQSTVGEASCLLIPSNEHLAMKLAQDADCNAETDAHGHRLGGYYRLAVYERRVQALFHDPKEYTINNDAITVPESGTKYQMSGSFTYMIWVYPKKLHSDWVRVLGKGSPHIRNYGLWIYPSGSSGWSQSQVGVSHNGWSDVRADQVPIPLDQWTHLVGRWDKHGNHDLFVNGSKTASEAVNGRSTAVDLSPLTIGKADANFHTGFVAFLRDARIYSTALNDAEIMSLASNQPPTPADWVYSGCYVNHGAARQDGHEQNKLGHSFGACAQKAIAAGAIAFGLEDPGHQSTTGEASCLVIPSNEHLAMNPTQDADCNAEYDANGYFLGGSYRLAVYERRVKECPAGYLRKPGDVGGWDAWGRDLNNKVDTSALCADDCNKRPDCLSYEWNPVGKECMLNKQVRQVNTDHGVNTYCERVWLLA